MEKRVAAPLAAVAFLFICAAGTRLNAQEAPSSFVLSPVVLGSFPPPPDPPPEPDPAIYANLPVALRINFEIPEPRAVLPPPMPSIAQLLRCGSCDINYAADMVATAELNGHYNPFVAAGNSICGVPQSLIGYCLSMCQVVYPGSGSVSMRQQDESGMATRLFVVADELPMKQPFIEGANRLLAKEQSYFASFSENPMYTFSVEQGMAEVDMDQFREDQRRVFLDVMRKTYLSRYFSKVEDRVRDDAWRFTQWRDVDFIVGPPLIAAYAWLRGIDRKISLGGDLKFRIQVEPLRRIQQFSDEDQRDLVGAVTMELGFNSFPLKAMVSFGYHNGEPEMDFVGIGTSVGEAKKIVAMTLEVEEPLPRD